MRAVAAYMASRNRNGGNERGNDRDMAYGTGMTYGGDMNRDRVRQPDQYPRSGMHDDWPESPEMRRRRDKRGRYMGDEGEEMRGEYVGMDYRPDYPIAPREPRNSLYDGGGIGFSNDEYRPASSHKGGVQPQSAQVGGTLWMKPNEGGESKLDKKTMEKWVHHMEDDKGQTLKPWSPEEIKPMAMRFGYPTSGERFDEFYTAIHMMKSDFCAVAEDFDVNTPAFYAALADAWLKDPDAALRGREKLETYYNCIVKGKK